MPIYIGQPCTYCREILTEKDDIVVCPECGSPYHRDCYRIEGKCINTDLHEKHESWQPEAPSGKRAENEQKTVICKNCGAENNSDAPFCKSCGAPVNLEKAAGGTYDRQYQGQSSAEQGGYPPLFGFVTINKDEDIDGNTAGEYSDYVKTQSFYFVPKFMRFAKGSRLSFNFSAFLFSHIYFFYRKMIPEGIALLLIQSVLSLPSALYMLKEYNVMSAIPIMDKTWFINMTNIFSILSYLLSIAAGVFANYLYYRKAKNSLNKIKSDITEQKSQKEAIAASGGTSLHYVLTAVLISTVFSFVLLYAVIFMVGGAASAPL